MIRVTRAIAAAVALAGTTAATTAARPPLVTAVTDPYTIQGDANQAMFAAISDAGAKVVRLGADWSRIAPSTVPEGFNPSDPNDPAYQWHDLDAQVEQAVAAGLQPILNVNNAPVWASRLKVEPSGVPSDPDPAKLAAFSTAIATRYSGTSPGIPRIRYWQLWNEPNISVSLLPQFKGGKPVSPELYRALLAAFADSVHGVSLSNVVIAGALSPFTVRYPTVQAVGPLTFMRALLCMSNGPHPHPTCAAAVHFDVWAHHPYTSGGPFHHAANPNDVSLGDLPKMKALLTAAQRTHHIVAPHGLRFWVTEFSWDTSPPDPHAVPIALQARWTAEALYQMWRSGVTLVTWWLLEDQPYPASSFQSGLYKRGTGFTPANRKLTWTAFRFPFVAYTRKGGVYVWGRTPTSTAGTVRIQRRGTHGWRTLATVAADRHGVFAATLHLAAAPTDSLRGVAGSSRSLPFSLTQPPDRAVDAFGR